MRPAPALLLRPAFWRGVLLAGAAGFVAYAAWALLLAPDPDLEDIVSSVLLIGLSLGGLGASWAVAWNSRHAPPLRRGWLLIGLACGTNALAETLWLEFRLRYLDPFPSTADFAYLAFYPLLLVGIFLLPGASTRPRERRVLWLDAAVGVCASLIIWWYFVFAPQIGPGTPDGRTLLAVLYPVGDALLISLLIMLVERSWELPSRRVTILLVLAMVMMTTADSVFAYFEPRELIYSYPPLNLLWASSYLLLFAAATRQATLLEAKTPEEAGPPNPRRRLAWVVIPYIAVAVAAGMLLYSILRSPEEPLVYATGVAVGTLVLFALVLFRQYLVLQENVDLHRQSAQASLTDELTGIWNRRHFFRALEHEVRRAVRYERPFSVLLFDVDDLKGFNDRFGHGVGDQVLVKAARLLADNVRALDTPARLGGDEFAVLLPETGSAAARIAASRLNASIRAAQVAGEPLSVSIGVASYKTGATADSIMEEADRELYRMKHERQRKGDR